ncbi:hypothetical protein SAMN05444166_7767 [Singulisphaera sp. GP187]|uniref:hypothetical protein n=1 Tax=Singulisphaera sp. GP187 TaxID=1882752 RepID=UPI0009258694|nr:hypothetical protein [Singulisphaera sp. GP187]SIO65627.1 hypothetical protein SAMN05444166_7767 [Singulisphaera sp. GP187]
MIDRFMAVLLTTRASRGHGTIYLPTTEEISHPVVIVSGEFRRTIDECFRQMTELFSTDFGKGYPLKDARMSVKQGLRILLVAAVACNRGSLSDKRCFDPRLRTLPV